MMVLDSKLPIHLETPHGIYIGPYFGIQYATIVTNYDGEISYDFVRSQFTQLGLDVPDFVMGSDANKINDWGQKTVHIILISRNMVFYGKN